jgi:hypothetical protein
VGLVAEHPEEMLVCGRSLCIIRALNDPVWLYYYLRREDVRKRILSCGTGSSMLSVNLGDLRDLTVAEPGPTQSAVVGERHGALLRLMSEIRLLYGQAETEMKKLIS